MIGAALTEIPGSSDVYCGGVISYTNAVKAELLSVPQTVLDQFGPVSSQVAEAMAQGIKRRLAADVAVSVTGLAGPGGDNFGNPVGTVYIGYSDASVTCSKEYHFSGDRQRVRQQAAEQALTLILQFQ